jgi:hypothetical protein
MKRYMNSILALCLIVGAIGSVALWEFYLKKRINTIEVAVAVNQLEPHAKIKDGDFILERRDKDAVPEGAFTSLDNLTNQEVWGVVAAKDVLTEGKLLTGSTLAPSGEERIYPIPSEWIGAVPGTLHRADKVDIYVLLDSKKIEKVQVDGEVKKDESGNSVKATATVQAVSDETAAAPILEKIPVAYVKDSSNQEVKIKEEKDVKTDANDRQDLTANPAKLELILKPEQFVIIKKEMEKGRKLLFAY